MGHGRTGGVYAITKAYYRGETVRNAVDVCLAELERVCDVCLVLQALRPVCWSSPPPTESPLRPSAAGGRKWRWRSGTYPVSWCRTKSICWTTRLSKSKTK